MKLLLAVTVIAFGAAVVIPAASIVASTGTYAQTNPPTATGKTATPTKKFRKRLFRRKKTPAKAPTKM